MTDWTGDEPLRDAFNRWTTSRGYAKAKEPVAFAAGWDARDRIAVQERVGRELAAKKVRRDAEKRWERYRDDDPAVEDTGREEVFPRDPADDAFVERDPFDRQVSEGGHIE